MLRKAITASLFTLLCAAAGAVPFASGGPEPAKPAHHHPATHAGHRKHSRRSSPRHVSRRRSTRRASRRPARPRATPSRHADDPGHGLALPESEDHRLRPDKPPILVYEKRGKSWQLAAFEWVFTEKPAKAPLPGAKYGAFPAACHYADGTFVPAAAETDCAKTSPESGAAFGFWHPTS